MASSAKQISFFLLLATLLSSLHTSHARDSQFFNKIPSTTSKNVVVPNTKEDSSNNVQQQDPSFLPQNENSYGLYGHESGQLPPSSTTAGKPATTTESNKQPLSKYLPKNYNPVAYVTQPEDINGSSATFAEENSYTTNPDNLDNNNNYYNGGAQNYYNGQQENEETEYRSYRSYPTATTTTNNNPNRYYYNGGSSFNSQPQGTNDAAFRGGAAISSSERSRFNNAGGEANGFQPQGLSDTRSLENGKYFYDVSTEKYSANHPYESLRGSVRPRNDQYYNNNNRNYYGNNVGELNNENTMGGYQNQENQFQYEEENNMP